jgi:hypothetical protein
MTFNMKPLSCNPARIKGMSERLIVSHYKNNYGGAVKRLNVIEEKLAELDYANVPGFLINGLKREQLIAMNSMILHELFFDGLGDQSEPAPNAGGRTRTRTLDPLIKSHVVWVQYQSVKGKRRQTMLFQNNGIRANCKRSGSALTSNQTVMSEPRAPEKRENLDEFGND